MIILEYKKWLDKLQTLRKKIAKNLRNNLSDQEKKELQELGIDRYITYEFLSRDQIIGSMTALEMAGYWLLRDLEKQSNPKTLTKLAQNSKN